MIAEQPEADRRKSARRIIATNCDGTRCVPGEWVLRFYDWSLGRTVAPGGSQDGLGHALTLFGGVGAGIIALLIYVQQSPEPDTRVIIIYFAVSLVQIIAMLSLCTSRSPSPNSSQPTFYGEHRRIIWRLLAASLLLMSGSAFAYWNSKLPGQMFLDTNTRGFPLVFERALTSDSWKWFAEVTGETANRWKLEKVFAYHDKRLSDRDYRLGEGERTSDRSQSGRHTVTVSATYYIVVRLEEMDNGDGAAPFTPRKEDINLRFERVTQ